jgi:hypothetical protein
MDVYSFDFPKDMMPRSGEAWLRAEWAQRSSEVMESFD